ncbi:hypothetical protein MMC09_004867 [Bachmanniomyces sp. S44760]|nr:hypothetical protein [Bachmanniomyces sp. S44760]
MNQSNQYLDSQQSHMTTGPSYTPQSQTSSMSQYPQYQQHASAMQPNHSNYAPSQQPYGQYAYANGVTSPQSAGQPASTPIGSQQLLPLPAMPGGSSQHGYAGGAGQNQTYPQQTFDMTGQIAPAGMKPRVTATLWEDEGSLCFQIEAKGVCVARREDNHMINGTKLLNVAGMTRGRRDGILKSEKMRHVVKIGPMHLKGVWIPYERALDFANREKITELLYPLFVHNIGALLYHPTNSSRTNLVMAAAERRNKMGEKQNAMIGPPGAAPPSLHHHHSMTNPVGPHGSQPPHSIAPHPGAGRPGLDRAHTFPTPPTSASSIMGMGNQGSSYEWGGQGMSGGVQGTQPLSIDTGLSNTRSMPTTPATTPPGNSMQTMQTYPSQQSYDNTRSMYSAAPAQQSQYAPQNVAQQNMARFGQPMQSSSYIKSEMGPPTARTSVPGVDGEHGEHKHDHYNHSQGNEQVGHGTGEEEAEHEHDTEYAHDNNAAYNASRGSYNYNTGPGIGSMHGEHPHLSPETVNEPPSHQNGSGRGTPRTTNVSQPQWAPGYHTPPRQPPSSNLYNVMSDARGSAPNGSNGTDAYGSTSLSSAYAPSTVNGVAPSTKRMREEDDQESSARPESRGTDIDLKRRKTVRENSLSTPAASAFDTNGRPINRTKSQVVQRRR